MERKLSVTEPLLEKSGSLTLVKGGERFGMTAGGVAPARTQIKETSDAGNVTLPSQGDLSAQ